MPLDRLSEILEKLSWQQLSKQVKDPQFMLYTSEGNLRESQPLTMDFIDIQISSQDLDDSARLSQLSCSAI